MGLINSPIKVVTGSTYTIETGSTFTVPGGTSAILVQNNAALDTAPGATDILFTGNTAGQGGAVYNSGTFTATSVSFSTNTAVSNYDNSNGGAIFNSGSLEISGSTFSGNTAGQGGAIWLATGGTINLSDSTVTGNRAVYIEMRTGSQNNSGRCGAITIQSSAKMEADGLVCNDNTAKDAAGAISVSGTFTVTDSTFDGNRAIGSGSGDWESNVMGGAIKVENAGGVLGATNTTFSNNYSAWYGGAIVNNVGKNTVIDTCTFSGNTAKFGGALYNTNGGIVEIKNSIFDTASDSIFNVGELRFFGTNTLNSVLYGQSGNNRVLKSYSGEEDVILKATTNTGAIGNGEDQYNEQTYIAQGFKTTFDGLKLDGAVVLGGKQNDDVDKVELLFNSVTMTTSTKIYGAGEANGTGIMVGEVNLSFTGSGMGAKALVCAGGAANGAKITATTVTVNASATGDMGILYGGADLTNNGSFAADVVETTITDGHWLSFVGNGSRGESGINSLATEIGDTVLTIKGGTFDKLVYAGAFAAGDKVSAGSTELNISGSTFNYMVFGGNGGNSIANSAKSTVTGDTHVTVTVGGANDILFNYTLFSGSYGEGLISGKTYMTFSGDNADGTMLSFAKDAYVSGGSQKAWHGSDRVQTYVFGGQETEPDVDARYLTFDGYTGKFGASMSNGFSNVEFKDSRVEFTGAVDGTEVDLRWVKVWNFDVSDGNVDLTWEKGTNDFAGDTINLTGWDGSSERTFMTGSDATLKGWDKASVSVDRFTSDQYTIKRNGDSLMICAA